MHSFARDLTYSLRLLARQRTFTVTSIAVLALGIGANVAIFSVVNAALLKPVPYPAADRLVVFTYTFDGSPTPGRASETKFNVWRQQSDVFEHVSAVRFRPSNVTFGAEIEELTAGYVSDDAFALFGTVLAAGRPFTPDEHQVGGPNIAVLGYGLWQRRFGGRPDVLERTITLDGTPHVIVGVVGPALDTDVFGRRPDVWLPIRISPGSTDHPPSLFAIGRLRPNVTLADARLSAQRATSEFRRLYPDAIGSNDILSLQPFLDAMVRDARPALLVLIGAVGLVLLMACANVASLLLVRASARRGEMALRAMLGATRGKQIRQLLAEALVLSIAGGTLGLLFGVTGVRALVALSPTEIPRVGIDGAGIAVDWRVLTFALVVSIVTGVIFGLAPVLRSSGDDFRTPLAQAPGRGAGTRVGGMQAFLVAAEFAIALVLLIGAGLLVRTFVALRTADRGFDTGNVLVVRTPLPQPRYDRTADVTQLIRTGTDGVKEVTGVAGVSATCCVPLESDWRAAFFVVGRAPTARAEVSLRIVAPEYFDVLGIRVLRGRTLADGDTNAAPQVAVINQAMARRFWPGDDPLRDRIVSFPGHVPEDEPARQIVGIVADARDGTVVAAAPQPTVYLPLAQLSDRENASILGPSPLAWLVRTHADTPALEAAVVDRLRRSTGLAGAATSLESTVVASSAETRFNMVILVLFGGVALALAGTGVFGVMSYSVQQRTPEIGIRVALGAAPSDVRQMIVRHAMRLASTGAVVGLCAAFVSSTVLERSLFGVTSRDPFVFATASVTLIAVALVAAWIPARQAARLDPRAAIHST